MSDFPLIRTAIPRRRYQVGEFIVSLLGDIDSGDGVEYAHILAFVREGEAKPVFYVCAERNPPGERSEGSHRLRVVNSAMSEVLGHSDRWRDAEAFAEEALELGAQALGLGDETPYRLT
jgi:hypothetical protein